MKELFNRQYLVNFLFLPVFALGSFYDDRLGNDYFNATILFSMLFFLSFIFLSKRKSNKKISLTLVFILITTSIINIINWSIWGVNDFEDYSVNKYIVLSFITIPICLLVSKFKTEKDFSVFFKQISLIGLLLVFLGFIQIIANGVGDSRLAVFGGGPIVFSRWVGFFVIIFTINYDLKLIFKIPIILICITLMIFSGSKGPFFFLVLTFFIVQIKNKKLISFILLVSITVRYQLDTVISALSANPMLVRIFGLNETSNLANGTSSSGRFSLLENSIVSIQENIFGYGMGNFSIYSDFSRVLTLAGYPHNFLLEIWLELGLIVLVITLFLFSKIFIDLYKSLYKNLTPISKNKKAIICIWIFYFFNSMVSGDLSDARFLIVFSTVYYTYLEFQKKNNENTLSTSIFQNTL